MIRMVDHHEYDLTKISFKNFTIGFKKARKYKNKIICEAEFKKNNNVKISKVNSGDENWILLLYNYYLRKIYIFQKQLLVEKIIKFGFKKKAIFIKISKNKTNLIT